ncbi:glycosyl transferase [Rhodoblastus sphagnicola]|uniref:Glycosyl transferase n=1 Tax=Rhodoblastus sphagnicola TaxID=333368 RepID=A0A2S6MU10_9HYPH|nr:glucoamylase family protein [Rhodoblastus sphagnicola]MBB4199779.1 cyclic beta-1,2-glucan synthetase [Rhodoblastus sphagnicola]PPQ25839.1 glycosyl transferase [Rhodoblastus sphagnicola]
MTFVRNLFARAPSAWDNPEPVREELFSAERIEEHARSLAAAQTVTREPIKGHPLAARLAQNGAVLLAAYKNLLLGADEGRAVTPAAEWLIDNYHLIEKQIREIRSDLPAGYYRQLPKLLDGPFAGYPRVFGMAWAFVAHTDSRFDSEMLVGYVRAYQEVQPLTIGELWAVSITLRIVMIENLRRLADEIVQGRAARHLADALADRLLGVSGKEAEPARVVLADHEDDSRSKAFAVQLIHRLRDQDPKITPALNWLDQRLAAQKTSANDVVREVHRRQGAASVTVRNIITSLRLISDVDWQDLFEEVSLVDAALGEHAAYKDMDFPTRNLYRTAIEDLARGSDGAERDIARQAVATARRFDTLPPEQTDARKSDPGYHLIGGGRRDFETEIGYHPRRRRWRARLHRANGIGLYAGVIACAALILLAAPLLALAALGAGAGTLGLLACLGAIPAIDAGVALVNRAVGFGFHANLLPALELAKGVPAHLRTLVAVPTLLTNAQSIEEQIEGLEIHHLASPEGDLHFALLSDWLDADAESVEGDEDLLAVAVAGVARLNARYGPAPGGPRFLLLHRRRVWNESQSRWIGWERKRGKLHELNRFLRGADGAGFIAFDGVAPVAPANIRYVVTLDGDTRLPRETVRRLIGKMAHPLNRPRFDAAAGRIVEGYGVLQPRVTPSLPVGREGSLFQRIFSSLSGIDPYASAVSDVYQDMFGEGSYAGKGIYDIDAFEAAMAGRVSDSMLLSHDLFEGIFARAGLASDVEVVEEFPSRYDVGALRHHRWARGDWQLLPWIVGMGPRAPGAPKSAAAMPAIGRWKMLDNLRRTLSAPLAVFALLAGFLLPFPAALVWTLFVVATIALPPMIPVIAAASPPRPGITLKSHFRALGGDFKLALILSALTITFLADQAWLMGDAILRTLHRLLASRKNLLEWVPAAQASQARRLDLGGYYRRMFGASVFAALALVAGAFAGGANALLASVFAALWLASPALARWVSLPPRIAARAPLSEEDANGLRLTARRTWRFFETFVTEADHMLPPDNFQEDPTPRLARRTSPTNIGLYLLSAASARDFGWIGLEETVARLEATLATMSGMARFRGHFYNWYDTGDLRPLDPKYVSSVDSGNLAGHLIALANACREWRFAPADDARALAGVRDAVALARKEAAGLRDGPKTQTVTWRQLDTALAEFSRALSEPACPRDDFPNRLVNLALQAATMVDMARALASERGDAAGADMLFWAQAGVNAIAAHRADYSRGAAALAALHARLEALEDAARSMALDMDFAFLIDRQRNLLSIGCLAPEGALDANCYDLLASEARLASFFAIAKGDLPARHWFHLGRTAIPVAHGAALISWSGSMFEYLMPSLVMRAPTGSLLDNTNHLVVAKQIAFATRLGLPWGVSESAYNARDLELTYQYSNFGIPGLGLKRGLADSVVLAPYATGLATMVDPHAARANLERLANIGARGRYGFYEALDYTPARVPFGQDCAIVRAFMAHHQGMTIVAIANAVLDAKMRTRFHSEPMVQATELLLQERMPRDVAVTHPWASEIKSPARKGRDVEPLGGRRIFSAHQAHPATHLLSNGFFSTMLTAAGSGYSRWGKQALTRWREDSTSDDFGSYVFLRDVHSDAVWSAAFQPIGDQPDSYHVAFNEDRAEFTRRDGALTTTLDVVVSSEDNSEVRRVSVTNGGARVREIEITSYAELALAPQAADVAHPAFSKLFVETEFLPDVGALVATRRRRDPNEPEIWVGQLAIVDGETIGGLEFETDRARFLGRGQGIRTPFAMSDRRRLSNGVGAVLDPIFALRRRVRIAPGAVARISFWTMAASTRETLLDIADKHRDDAAFARATTLAWTQAQVQLHHLGVTAGEASLFQRLASPVIYANATLRPPSPTIVAGAGAQSGLWPQGISGDLPIVLLRISDADDIDVARELLQAHEYWRMKQLAVDLVILNERQSSYVQDLQIALETLIRARQMRPRLRGEESGGSAFVLRSDLIPAETSALLASVARVVIVAQRGGLFEQLERIVEAARPPAGAKAKRPVELAPPPAPPSTKNLEFFNGLGGFARDGREYVTILGPGQATPAPWINVVANESFGFQAATEGGGYTWSLNSRENQLTPWSNDPVSDRSGEAFYLRDEDNGDYWSPTALPIRLEEATYVARFGRGYSRFEHTSHDIQSELLQFVPTDGAIKISRLKLRNLTGRVRRLGVTAFVEWALGPSRSAGVAFVTTALDSSGAIFARNRWSAGFGSRVAFADFSGRQTDWTGDRREFIGRNGTLRQPAAIASGASLSNALGAGLDPCAALRSSLTLAPGASVEVVFLLGQGEDAQAARHLVEFYRAADLDAVFAQVGRHWDDLLGAVTVKTPDRSMDIMLNGWLLYQTVACRLWARAAFYQASGAYGFRDQLQDVLALAASHPAMTRAQILRAAGRQFGEGDVQHWWLPHSGQGVRTRISDDRAWLAFAIAHYVRVSGDAAVLDEQISFVEGRRLEPSEHDGFFTPSITEETASLYEHGALALDSSLELGGHGLPLIGAGDWNDGMNRVGAGGAGESVWLGWLLFAALNRFAPFAEARGEFARAETWRAHAIALRTALEREGWDGDWYRRGFFDDGTPLGSSQSEECRIDCIAQSWAALSGAASPERAAQAMASVGRELIRRRDGLAPLFAPPFDKTPLDPGYIKGYPPGIRENGGQYTHAALWSVMAFAELGQGDKAASLFAMLNPINHARTRADAHRYKVEPYVVAADVYTVAPHVGRGGWTWYTGSAAWMQRAGLESILGVRREGDTLHVDPCIPKSWSSFEVTLRHGDSSYEIRVENPDGVERGVVSASIDGEVNLEPRGLPLVDDGATRRVVVRLGCV